MNAGEYAVQFAKDHPLSDYGTYGNQAGVKQANDYAAFYAQHYTEETGRGNANVVDVRQLDPEFARIHSTWLQQGVDFQYGNKTPEEYWKEFGQTAMPQPIDKSNAKAVFPEPTSQSASFTSNPLMLMMMMGGDMDLVTLLLLMSLIKKGGQITEQVGGMLGAVGKITEVITNPAKTGFDLGLQFAKAFENMIEPQRR